MRSYLFFSAVKGITKTSEIADSSKNNNKLLLGGLDNSIVSDSRSLAIASARGGIYEK